MQNAADDHIVHNGYDDKMLKTLEQILNILRGSTIAEEGANDVRSKFWATYKKVSNEYDKDFLERTTDDMGIILTFAGLFSAVNSTFIIGMKPNPGDTTNVLMVQLIQAIANGSNAVNVSDLSSSTPYPSSTVWMQTLSYASLGFSVLTALGAVMGKQWINSYKAAQGLETLEERSLKRQMKLDGINYWHLQFILAALLILLQISLLLFGLSLSANMFGQQITISSVVISTTAFGVIFYLATVLVSVLSPYSPFQSPSSKLVRIIFEKYLPSRSTSSDDLWRTVRWMLEKSTNPDFVSAAAAMIPHVKWPTSRGVRVNVGTICGRLRETFAACDRLECVEGIAHFWAQSVGDNRDRILGLQSSLRDRLIRNAFAAAHSAWLQFSITEKTQVTARERHMYDARAALRRMMVYGRINRFSLPDEPDLIWLCNLRLQNDERLPSCEFDWLFDYLEVPKNALDDKTIADALLALSAMRTLGSSNKRGTYIQRLIFCMDRSSPPRVRSAAFRATIEAREELASTPPDVDAGLLDRLSDALFNVATESPFYHPRDRHYLRLVFSLAASNEWRQRLSVHVERCTSFAKPILDNHSNPDTFYLVGILLRVDPSGTAGLSLNPRRMRWRELISKAWHSTYDIPLQDIFGNTDVLSALVETTRKSFLDLENIFSSPMQRLDGQRLVRDVNDVLERLGRLVNEEDETPINAIFAAVRALHDDLSRKMTEITAATGGPNPVSVTR